MQQIAQKIPLRYKTTIQSEKSENVQQQSISYSYHSSYSSENVHDKSFFENYLLNFRDDLIDNQQNVIELHQYLEQWIQLIYKQQNSQAMKKNKRNVSPVNKEESNNQFSQTQMNINLSPISHCSESNGSRSPILSEELMNKLNHCLNLVKQTKILLEQLLNVQKQLKWATFEEKNRLKNEQIQLSTYIKKNINLLSKSKYEQQKQVRPQESSLDSSSHTSSPYSSPSFFQSNAHQSPLIQGMKKSISEISQNK